MKSFVSTFALLITTFMCMQGQELNNYRWENRILLLLTESIDDASLEIQLSEIKSLGKELGERKLVVFIITKNKSFQGLNFNKSQNNTSIYPKYKKTRSPFEMVLIGLDGGVKERFSEHQPLSDIFAIIDGMPMRKSELAKKKE